MSNDGPNPSSATTISSQVGAAEAAGTDPDSAAYHSSASHRHHHTVSSISHISRATIHDDDLQSTAPILFSIDQDMVGMENAEGEKETPFEMIDKSTPAHIRSKSALIDQPRIHIPSKFESFSNSAGAAFTTSTGRRPSVVCLKVNANAARAGKHRIEHIESPALFLETGFGEGHTDPEMFSAGSSSTKQKSPAKRPTHRKQASHRLTIPDDGPALADPWSAYLDTSCDSSSNFIPGPTQKKIVSRAKQSVSIQKDKKRSLSFVIGEQNIALSEKEHQQVVIIEPRKPEPIPDDRPPTFIISQGKSITDALNQLSLEKKSTSKTPRRFRNSHSKDISQLRKTLMQMCTLIVDEAVRTVYDDSKYQRRQQRRRGIRQEAFSEMISAMLKQTGNTWRKTPSPSRQRKSWNTTESSSDS